MVGRSKDIGVLLRNCPYLKNYIDRNRGIPRSWGLSLRSLEDDNPDKLCRELTALAKTESRGRREHFSQDIKMNLGWDTLILFFLIILFLTYRNIKNM
ncbi:MAG: hypothetical protein CMF62_02100 [Magnetococcales bacterium]|nr:hypothetical protein [Magnetococcales bacterium]|tara:strand:- start:157367 stop:157660 length:294 start_codon:yes stop_codon:yes gene_type:complete